MTDNKLYLRLLACFLLLRLHVLLSLNFLHHLVNFTAVKYLRGDVFLIKRKEMRLTSM